MRKLMAMRRKSSRWSRLVDPPGGRVVEEVLARRRRVGAGAMDVPGGVHPQAAGPSTPPATGPAPPPRTPRRCSSTLPLLRFAGRKEHRPLAGHLPAQPPGEKLAASGAPTPAARDRRFPANATTSISSDHSVRRGTRRGAPADCRGTAAACCRRTVLAAPGRWPAPCGGSRSRGTARPGPR